jgi:hypothetical protein
MVKKPRPHPTGQAERRATSRRGRRRNQGNMTETETDRENDPLAKSEGIPAVNITVTARRHPMKAKVLMRDTDTDEEGKNPRRERKNLTSTEKPIRREEEEANRFHPVEKMSCLLIHNM